MSTTCLTSARSLYSSRLRRLRIPGLAEKKPGLIVGDKLLLCTFGAQEVWHEGIVHDVQEVFIVLRINPKFKLQHSGDSVNVRFQINRMPWRRRQQAVTLGDNQRRLLIPGIQDAAGLHCPTAAEIEAFAFENPWLTDNHEQQSVVAAIVNSPPGSVPFIVFGPYVLLSFEAPEDELISDAMQAWYWEDCHPR